MTHEANITALMPMKGHSERVPNKNLRDFCGRPLYHAVMDQLLASRFVSGIVVNTDSDRIMESLRESYHGRVTVHERPQHIRGDSVPMNEIIAYDVDRLKGEHFLQTHSTNPLLENAWIDLAIERYFQALEEGYDSLFSVTRLQTRLYDATGHALNHDPKMLLRTQDLPPVFEENSCIYIFSRASFHEQSLRIGKRPLLFEIPPEQAWDIDEELDFMVAELLYTTRRRQCEHS